MNDEYDSFLPKVIAVLIIGGLIAGGIVIGVGYEKVEYNEIALLRNEWDGTIDYDTIYTAGRYWVGVWGTFIKFPAMIQTVTFNPGDEASDIPISGRSKGGSQITLDVSFQYMLNKTNLGKMYEILGDTYEDTIIKKARDTLRNIMALYETDAFYINRSIIGDAMTTALREELASNYVDLYEFQLTNIDFPDNIDQAIATLEAAIIDQQVATEEQRAASIRAQTLIINAIAAANVSLLTAENEAEVLLIQTQATVEALNMTLQMDAYQLSLLMNATYIDEFGVEQKVFTNSTDLLTYLWVQAVLAHDESYLIISGSTPIIVTDTNDP